MRFLPLVLLLLLGCRHRPPVGDREATRCGPFRWADDAKSAILVDVVVGRVPGIFQLDTGLDVTTVHSAEVAKRKGLAVEQLDESTDVINAPLSIAGVTVDRTPIFVANDLASTDDVMHGSIGMDVFFGRVVTLDYPRRRLCIDAAASIDDSTFELLPMRVVAKNRVQPEAKLNGQVDQGLVFDTGSSAFAVLADRDRWQALTGRRGDEPGNTVTVGSSWGNPIHVIGAPLRGALELGSTHFEAPLAHFISEAPDRIAQMWSGKATGILGNALFFDRVVIIDTRPGHMRFGVGRAEAVSP